MSYDKAKVRQILDQVKKAGRDSLTAPEGKVVCDAYGISVPKEVVASSPPKRRNSRTPWASPS